jgi:DNA-damage-inducible protein J
MQTKQLQVRMDAKTKKDAQEVLANLGLDASTAVKVLFKQIARTKSFPIDLRDPNGYTPKKAHEMRNAVAGAKKSKQAFASAKDVLLDATQ